MLYIKSWSKHMDVNDRAILEAEYIIDNKATVRQTAKEFGISKSTIYIDITERLKKLNPYLHKQVNFVLQYNKNMRSARGGMATKQKNKTLKEQKH